MRSMSIASLPLVAVLASGACTSLPDAGELEDAGDDDAGLLEDAGVSSDAGSSDDAGLSDAGEQDAGCVDDGTLPVAVITEIAPTGEGAVAFSSSASTSGVCAPIVRTTWALTNKPIGSSAALSTTDGETTELVFDVFGAYTVTLEIEDALGRTSTATTTAFPPPDEGLMVQLTWSTADGDLDLHLARPGDVWCDAATCYGEACVAASPEWDGVPGMSDGDPRLDIDDASGFGPENITVDAAEGTYRIGVELVSLGASAAITAQVKAYARGVLFLEETHELSSGASFVDVATIAMDEVAQIVDEGGSPHDFTCADL